MATTTDLTTLKINYLTQAQYDTALSNNQINANELYLTPASSSSVIDTAGTGLSKSGTTLNHSNSVTAGTAGTSSATSGSTLAVPYITYDAQGHITATGTHTHTVSGFLTSSSTLDATKLSGTIPSGCYTNTDTKVKLTSNSGSTAVPLVLGPTSISSGTAYECLYNTSVTCTPSTGLLTSTKLTVASVDHTITSSEYTTIANALDALV